MHSWCFFLNSWLVLVIPAVITQVFNHNAELEIPIEIQINWAKTEIETQPMTVETQISKCPV